MNNKDTKYNKYALVKEMLETSEVISKFDPDCNKNMALRSSKKRGLFLTGEGSSRIFPAKRAQYASQKSGSLWPILTEGSTQAMDYKLDDFAVFGASNSGQTKEVVRLFQKIGQENHDCFFSLTANPDTTLEKLALDAHVMNCGKEDAVAATKSVFEQGLFYDGLLRNMAGDKMSGLDKLADQVSEVLTMEIDQELIDIIKNADMIYFAGKNTGVAEELTLKTNEITRIKSDFLEGTYAVHGIEEVMDKKEVVIIVDPFESEEEKFQECLTKGVGMPVIAIASRETSFPTIRIPDGGQYKDYVELAAGWNLLVEIGIALGIDLDKPVRARKVGNEYIV